MDGMSLIARMKPLSQVENIKDVMPLTEAVFPGTHCPLMGAAIALRGIRDSLLVVIGTEECAYYTKHMTVYSDAYGGIAGRCVSMILDGQDVTFGCTEQVAQCFEPLMKEYQPKAVFLVTTCVVEIIGDDMDAVAERLSERYGIPIMAVHTEHFKCENHLPGLERTMTACLSMMEKQECDGSVNLLGQRLGNFSQTELSGVLARAGVKIGLQLPCGCSVDEIRRAPAARLNIVVNETALPLARKMQETFGIPYVFFDRFTDPERIAACYARLFSTLELPVPEEVKALESKARAVCFQAKNALNGVTFIYGNTPFRPFEMIHFMTKLWMIPQVVQLSAITPEDEKDKAAILSVCDPYVTKTANIAPMRAVYDVLHPMLYLGHEYAEQLREKGIALLQTDEANGMLGFECTLYLVQSLMQAAQEAREIRKEAALS